MNQSLLQPSQLFFSFLLLASLTLTLALADSKSKVSPHIQPTHPPVKAASIKAKASFADLRQLLVQAGYINLTDDDQAVQIDDKDIDQLKELSRQEIKMGEKKILAVYFERDGDGLIWGSDTILALYSFTPKLHLLAAANVQGDRECYPEAYLSVSPADDVLVVCCAHLSAGADHFYMALYGLIGGKIDRLDQSLPIVYSAYSPGLQLYISDTISVLKDPQGKRGKIVYKIREIEKHVDDDGKLLHQRLNIYRIVLFPQGKYFVVSPHDKGIALMERRRKEQGIYE